VHSHLSESATKPIHATETPPKVKGWPTRWCTKDQLQQYYLPLHKTGWNIDNLPDSAQVLALAKTFPMADLQSVRRFIAQVDKLADEEKHHPHRMLLCNNGPNSHTVTFTILTHSATPFTKESGERPPSGLGAGVTQRDIRLAVLIESLYVDQYSTGHVESAGTATAAMMDSDLRELDSFTQQVKQFEEYIKAI